MFKTLLRVMSLFFTFPWLFLDSAVSGLSIGCQSHLKIIIISIQLTGCEPENLPHGLYGGAPDPSFALQPPYYFEMSFFPSRLGAHLAFQDGFVNTEKSTLALGSMEELETVCSLKKNFHSDFRVGGVSSCTRTHHLRMQPLTKQCPCATPYNQRKPPGTRQLVLHMRVKGSVPRRPGRFKRAQLQNQRSRYTIPDTLSRL